MKKVIPFTSSVDSDSASLAKDIPMTPIAGPVAKQTLPPADGAEQLLLLLQRLVGCTNRGDLIARFYRWTSDLSLAHGVTYEPAGGGEIQRLGEKRHHNAEYALNLDGEDLGKLTLCRRERYDEEELIVIEQALGSLARCLHTSYEFDTFRTMAAQDPLTGLGNRSSLQEGLSRELARARRYDNPLTLMMIDVDHFKAINDEFGHLGGDHILRAVARVFECSTRKSDLLYRFGGDEFTVILPHTDRKGAEEAASQIRMNLARLNYTEFGLGNAAKSLRIGLSIGIAEYQMGDDDESLLQRADTHVYHAKARGRGRVCSHV